MPLPDEEYCHQQPCLYDVDGNREIPEDAVVHELQHDCNDQAEAEQQERLLEIGVETPKVSERVPLGKARGIECRKAEPDDEEDAYNKDDWQAVGLHSASLLQKACLDVQSALDGVHNVVVSAHAGWSQVQDGTRASDSK